MSSSSSSNSPCAACKFLRRKCTQGCVFAPYFPSDNPQKFANVHRVFGASNVAKLLTELGTPNREDAVNSLAYEADARMRDPVYGCFGYVYLLQHKIRQIHQDLDVAKMELASYIGPTAFSPYGSFGNAAATPQSYHQPHFLASASTSAAPFGAAAVFRGIGVNSGLMYDNGEFHMHPAHQQQLLNQQQLPPPSTGGGGGGGGEEMS